ncbi:enolase C-terminal domain-like protein [Xanthobacter sp. KR7-65]|uniref:mandelate racemase/muconate lactonizing enzyme family protein n=1 Tax=Xanthobacter sp. KR7-65 TaxID=3156612 RepID=UPI0032B37DBF
MIERIEVFVTELPIRLKRIFSSGSYDTGPAGQLLGKPVFVKIHADGVVGCAQIRPISPGHFVADTTQSVVAAIKEIYGPNLIGRSIFDIEAITEMFDLRLAGNPAARAVLDIALHDAQGKALGVPASSLLGGRCQDTIPLEWSVSLADDIAVMIAEAKRAVDEFGIKVLCLKAAGKKGWREDVRNFEQVRKAVGDDIVIGVDPNTGWTVPDSIAAMEAMRPFDVGYVEQPVGRRDLAGLAEIRRNAHGVPLMADESLFTIEDATALAEAKAVDVFCIKLYKVGGLTPARKIAAVAQGAGIPLNCGGLATVSTFEAMAAAHFCATIPARRTFGAAEFVFGLGPIGRDPLVAEGAPQIRDGAVAVPQGPGLGLILDEAALEKATLLREVVTR